MRNTAHRGGGTAVGSPALAALSALALVVACACAGTLALATRGDGTTAAPLPPSGGADTTRTTTSTAGARRTTTESTSDTPTSATALPPDFEVVTGANGMTTAIPVGATLNTRADGTATDATTPDAPDRVLRFGGALQEPGDILTVHRAYAQQVAAQTADYREVELRETTYHGVPAVLWEYENTTSRGPRHSRSVYWRLNGVEYFLIASSTPSTWAETAAAFTVMVDNSTP
ncbi:hypothetical protein L6E12_30535 [Actinokineospora sp. PR83]|uniref:hypothetical protein n=1 Tax=Actinokineospora sp. PR83 TaxID=2884908 RepID=UPI001F44BE99|nr:hypothetical protein [Actinokineospora sp. PR83]MCG8920117.1 hypothetical protein [Actinokineospora sp. PR83]